MQINSNIENNLAKAMNKVTVPKRSRSYELCVKADAMRFAKLYQESVKYYLDSIMMDRDHQEAYWGLAFSYKYLEKYSKAINMLEKLVKIDDKNDKYFYELGVCHLCDGHPEKAIPHLVQSIVINKENLEIIDDNRLEIVQTSILPQQGNNNQKFLSLSVPKVS